MQSPLKRLVLPLAMLALTAGVVRAQDEFGMMTSLDGVIADMQVADGRLAKYLTDKPTRQRQLDAISKLDLLIKELEEQRGQPGGRSTANPRSPLRDSMIIGGPGGSGPLHDANRQGRSWGQLPPHKREQILQSMTEGFPPHYQQLLERYYRRLAEERPADDVEAPSASRRKGRNGSGPARRRMRSSCCAASSCCCWLVAGRSSRYPSGWWPTNRPGNWSPRSSQPPMKRSKPK